MADLVFRSTTRGGRDFFEVTDDGMAYGGKDRYNIKTDESMNYADTVDEVLAELVFDGAWRINYDKIEVDELGIGDEYKEIVKLIRKKYNWLYNLPKGSKGKQFYYDIGRYFRQELKKGTDAEKIFDKIDSVIEKNNNFEESKKENKIMKKNRMTERFDAPKDWDFDEMVEDYGEEYLNEVGSDWEDYVHNMDDLEYYLEKEDLNWLLNRIYYGGQYIKGDFNTKETFDPNEEYYVVNGYGNFYSLSEYYKNDFIKDKIEELNDGEESFYDWCVEQGYFESEEDDE